MSTDWEDVQAPNSFRNARSEESDDVSFAYYFRWDCPDAHIKEALRNLLARCADNETQSNESRQKGYEEELVRVRFLIATNPNTPPPVLDHLIKRADPALLERIAEHPRLLVTTLRKLAADANPEVRAAVAENLNTPPDALRLLANDENADVRYRLAENANTSEELLRLLSEDDNPYVAHRASKTLSKLIEPAPPVTGPFYTLPWQRQAEM